MQKAVRCIKRAAFFVDRRDAQYAPAECALDFGLAQSGNVLLSQVFPHVLNPPLAAHMGEPNQVQCCTLIEDDQRVRTLQMESEQDWFSGSSHEKQRLQNT